MSFADSWVLLDSSMAGTNGTKNSVIAALLGNTFVTVIKFIAFAVSGSGAMLSEAIHSAADTGNQGLLYLGLRRAARSPDEDFHYGYGGERFIFGMLSASGIFFVGCGVTIYHGIHSLLSPKAPELGWLTFLILGISFVVEGSVLLLAVRSVNRERGSTPFLAFVRNGADPATVAILLEDGVAVSGVLVATVGMVLAHVTGQPAFDAAASILIGVLLGLVAVYLVLANRSLLLGESVPEGVEQAFIDTLCSHSSVAAVEDVKTRQLTPEAFTLKAEVVFVPEYFASKEGAKGLTGADLVRFTLHAVGEEIDAIEHAVRKVIPQARHIDIEVSRGDKAPPSISA